MCNPGLSGVITEKLGDAWITDLSALKGLRDFTEDVALLKDLDRVKQVKYDDICHFDPKQDDEAAYSYVFPILRILVA